MSSDKIVLNVEKRNITGKRVRSLRKDGKIPATVYQRGKESFNVMMDYIPFTKVFSVAGTSQPIEITIDGNTHLTMIKDVHLDPAKNTIMHVAFHAVRRDRIVEADIPVHIEGDVPAEKLGFFIVRPNDHAVVRSIPANLPERYTLSAEKLINPGDKLTVEDLNEIKDVEMISEISTLLAVVEEPRAVEEPEVEDDEEVDAADVPSDNGGEDEGSNNEVANKKSAEEPETDKK